MQVITRDLLESALDAEPVTSPEGDILRFVAECFDANEVLTGSQIGAHLRTFAKRLEELAEVRQLELERDTRES